MKKLIICFLFCLIPLYSIQSQSLSNSYKAAVGIRVGETSGPTFKFNSGASSNIELIAGVWSDWISITGLYEVRAGAFNVSGMNWYYGAGGHAGFATGTYYQGGRLHNRGDDFAIGVDGILGLEYKIPPIPFAISLDLKPLVEVYRNGDIFFGLDPGLGVKFTF